MKRDDAMDKLIITPRTKIYDLLEAYPQLEDVLIGSAPQFKKLKNPLLRKTISKITNLGQAAAIGGLKVEVLVNKLRAEVGQTTTDSLEAESGKYNTGQPDWFNSEKISETIDIREMLNAGEQPVHEVLSAIKKLKENEILKVIAPFIPAPLIDKSLSMNYHHWLNKRAEEEYWVYFKN
jgi:TusA-related sulfurtransferase